MYLHVVSRGNLTYLVDCIGKYYSVPRLVERTRKETPPDGAPGWLWSVPMGNVRAFYFHARGLSPGHALGGRQARSPRVCSIWCFLALTDGGAQAPFAATVFMGLFNAPGAREKMTAALSTAAAKIAGSDPGLVRLCETFRPRLSRQSEARIFRANVARWRAEVGTGGDRMNPPGARTYV